MRREVRERRERGRCVRREVRERGRKQRLLRVASGTLRVASGGEKR